MPEDKGVEGLARQIKLTGRAYPIFDIAHLILKKPDRFTITFSVIKQGDSVAAPLFLCSLDDTLWLSEADVTALRALGVAAVAGLGAGVQWWRTRASA